ncbi:MAG: hypothetical protein A2033_01735 [Bacteroidetes bacterium GWA2_31_9]|nr:MAG: hypothetical protein A2033_01735 [Bacteroidetes bacterium GWA2_31_9]
MNNIFKIISSSKITFILLVILTFAMAIATFVEDRYDTLTAKLLIYNAKWFELVLVLLVFNLIGNILKYKLFTLKKSAVLLMHISFILMIIGAGVTRYTGFEGSMHIREGEVSNVIYTSDPHFSIKEVDKVWSFPIFISDYSQESFDVKFETKSNETIRVKMKEFLKNAVEVFKENSEGGKNILEITLAGSGKKIYINSGDKKEIENILIAYNTDAEPNYLKIYDENGKLMIKTPENIIRSNMSSTETDTLYSDSLYEFTDQKVYATTKMMFLFSKFYKSATKEVVAGKPGEKGMDAMVVDVEHNGKNYNATVFGGAGYLAQYQNIDIDGLNLSLSFGETELELPFSIYLRDFILERYPGSMSPSSYASEVTLKDSRNNLNEEHRIFMNNVLDHDGYRFFQSSYDRDEKGTVLSVNHDFLGTWITYIAYIILCIGFILTLFNKTSRFVFLSKQIADIQKLRKAGITSIIILLFSTFSFSQSGNSPVISAEHAEKAGHLLVQTYDGRIEPLHTLAIDIMHKISRKDKFELEGKGTINNMQAFIDMVIDAEYWKNQKIIYVKEQSVRDILGVKEKYASYYDFFDGMQRYKLTEYAESAFRKKQSEQNTFDKEIIKVDERINICMMVYDASFIKIFPSQSGNSSNWGCWTDSMAYYPLPVSYKVINDDLKLKPLSFRNMLSAYFSELTIASKNGNYSKADKIIGYIESIQRSSSIANQLPTDSQIDFEIVYNKSNIFVLLRNIYGILSFILLILAFVDNLREKSSKLVKRMLTFFIVLLGLAFLYHTYGMILRWYLSGHAPWSNGYEALLLVAWGAILGGFYFIKSSKITIASTALLAFFMLMTAGHSSYDPQLTNLQPVLKSYWLIIHVATLTISYSFLGSGLILGLINMMLYIFKNIRNATRLNLVIKELTYINEMNLILGIGLATIGTFLGGVWANESWGRYWGWDAKETWALIIVTTYTIILHLRFIPKMKSLYIFNVSSIIGFGSVLMTFIGVNYYLSKGMHSYGQGDTPIFPIWAWVFIISIVLVMVFAGIKEGNSKNKA